MCARLENVKTKHRAHLVFPNGAAGSPQKLEERFGDILPDERGRLSRKVLDAIPPHERDAITTWVKKKTSVDETPRPGPVDPALIELFVFYAVGHHATAKNTSINEMVGVIVAQKSAGVILAHA